MKVTHRTKVYFKDYYPPCFVVSAVKLDIAIYDNHTIVKTGLDIRRNSKVSEADAPLVLNGDSLELVSAHLDGRLLASDDYTLDEEKLTIHDVPTSFKIETQVRIYPENNKQFEGLYVSGGGYFTQCEPEGFRRITFFPDRPDVMSRYSTTIHADRDRCPVLLSNGNLEAAGEEGDNRHWTRWVDPFPKPCYLFAMVAARLDLLEDEIVTKSGRDIRLQLYVEPGKLDQCVYAMDSLKHAMRWDEDVFGLEIDLDQYMIVAVNDFNYGAMENKGLNIFNCKYILASADTATDDDIMRLDRVIAHEYCHNWTGNRVTCRDWFQLSLKEGLTIFRDQLYGEHRYSAAVQRIQGVRDLRNNQFLEDASPNAHPVRPAQYMEINNFYTWTVYYKGAEVVRMIYTLLGKDKFHFGMDLYFSRHDGQAVCTEDFVSAMQDASGVDLAQFQRWYHQAGTPVVECQGVYDIKQMAYKLTFRQSYPPAKRKQDEKTKQEEEQRLPLHIPIRLGLIDSNGHELPLCKNSATEWSVAPLSETASGSQVFSLTEANMSLLIRNVAEPPTPSILRGFSAPVYLRFDYTEEMLAHLLAHDSDPFCRWEASQQLAMKTLLDGIVKHRSGLEILYSKALVKAFSQVMEEGDVDSAFGAEALTLPAEGYIAEQLDKVDPNAMHAVRLGLMRHLATRLKSQFEEGYRRYTVIGEYSPDATSAGRRGLRNLCLSYLMELGDHTIRQLALAQVKTANNMTDSYAALKALADHKCTERDEALAYFYEKWQDEPLVIDKWFRVQVTSRLPRTLEEVKRLLQHPAYNNQNPNRVRALVGAFCSENHVHFHAADGSGYYFVAEQVCSLDTFNPQLASRIARAFDRWLKFDKTHKAHAKTALESIRNTPGLSKNTYEVVTRLLEAEENENQGENRDEDQEEE